ncbi:MAG: glycerol-3-phosphate dehydrogenase/oxidase [Phycisphaeraceae bacterium]|nr:glycerol-3-phosphate dehydrogenase/oxidase [Phycisphaeraceae bacterium]
MNRDEALARVRDRDGAWDVVVIGGGATGLGIAVDAASRGCSVLLLEGSDFAKGTSSRSTKLVHGGVRYLQQGNVSLVIEALRERGRLLRNAPHLVRDVAFVVPSYSWWESPFYGVGLKVYDLLAGRYGFGASSHLSRDRVIDAIPSINREGLLGGTRYYDGQFDDARLAINLAATAWSHGATLANYCRVTALTKDAAGVLDGVVFVDGETGEELRAAARVVVNATGPFADEVRALDRPGMERIIRPSQGAHVTLDRSFLQGEAAIMAPHTEDGRVMFAIPWRGVALVGTTDIPVEAVTLEPVPREEEIGMILRTANRYLSRPASRSDVRSAFAGIRPLVSHGGGGSTSKVSREHSVLIDQESGLMTVAGGKWTTYRKMAEDAVDLAVELGGLGASPCVTRELPIHGSIEDPERFGALSAYGSDAERIGAMSRDDPSLGERVCASLELTNAEVRWACRMEMARTVEDALSRRSRALLLDARSAIDAAPAVARLMAEELGRDGAWIGREVEAFTAIASGYVVGG